MARLQRELGPQHTERSREDGLYQSLRGDRPSAWPSRGSSGSQAAGETTLDAQCTPIEPSH
ncbi:MAG TPA: hypothetical protein DFR83_20325 [Deltaproteobacteria bacterium]|nr:hypothetical protein [Deltaproteobacteria bacterium]